MPDSNHGFGMVVVVIVVALLGVAAVVALVAAVVALVAAFVALAAVLDAFEVVVLVALVCANAGARLNAVAKSPKTSTNATAKDAFFIAKSVQN